jgi:hypothetical protein
MLVDTNVLVDVLAGCDPEWADWSIAQLRARRRSTACTSTP